MLKVLLDARKLGDGGIGTYLYNLISGLIEDSEVSLQLLVGKGKSGLYFANADVLQFEEASRSYSVDETFFLGPRISASSQFQRPFLFHEPHFTLPRGLTSPSVITVHDIIHISNPERWYYPYFAKSLLSSGLSRAKKIIAVSEATKLALIDNFTSTIRNLESRITVIPNAIAGNLLQVPVEWQELLRGKFGLETGYLFALFSMLKPHKGFGDLLEAYRRADVDTKLPQLILAGKGFARGNSESSTILGRLKNPKIKVLGEVSDQELAALYIGAGATVIPSLAEGFGLSALEAKVLGSKLIVRPLPSFSTIADEKDIVCKDLSLASLTDALSQFGLCFRRGPHSNQRNNELAQRFSVSSVARRTKEVYQEVYQG